MKNPFITFSNIFSCLLLCNMLFAAENESKTASQQKCGSEDEDCLSVSIEADWKNTKSRAFDNSIPPEVRIRELKNFLNRNPNDHQHSVYANKLIAMLEETGSIVLSDGKLIDYRNRNRGYEIFSLKTGVGILAPSISVSFFTIVKNRFYWEILQASGTAGWILVGFRGGTSLGFRKILDKDNSWEIRGGVATNIGINYLQSDYDLKFGLIISPEITFIKKKPSGFGWLVGIKFPFRLDLIRERYVDGYYEWQNDIKFEPLPNIGVFGGFLI